MKPISARTEGWSRLSVIAGASLWMLLVCNRAFWVRLMDGRDMTRPDELLFMGAVALLLLMLLNMLGGVLAVGRLLKPLLVALLLLAAACSGFVDRYGIAIDRSMVQNVFETDAAESLELLDAGLLAWLLFAGVLPAVWVVRARLRPSTVRAAFARRVVFVFANGLVASALLALFSAGFASEIRNDRGLRYQFNPLNALYSTWRYAQPHRAAAEVVPVGRDAKRTASGDVRGPAVFVLVVGETARAEDFSLGGHERQTNPRLQAEDVFYFSEVSACGTSTAVSLPCMFSDLGRDGFSETAMRGRENLLDVLARAGLDVLWVDNNSGCKGLCARVRSEQPSGSDHPRHCRDGECHDEVLVDSLRHHLRTLRRDTVIVLHQKGSHGPAYWRRYPPEFERFTPVCRTVNLDDCTLESLHNAYDNTILYTDHVLSEIIGALQQMAGIGAAAMLYVSDHGESLGEKGIYLHGAPRAIAPEVQYRVPMIFWASPSFMSLSRLKAACLEAGTRTPLSHDNLFHSVLGLLDVRTSVYRTSLDMFAACRAGEPD